MVGETVRLADYAAGLRYEDLPKEVIAAAKDAIIDTIAACICGSALPWSRIIIDYAERTGPGGASHILGRGSAVQAPAAALANGALAATAAPLLQRIANQAQHMPQRRAGDAPPHALRHGAGNTARGRAERDGFHVTLLFEFGSRMGSAALL